MRYRAEQRPDASWVIYDTHKKEICFATRSYDRTLAERWAETFNTAYSTFRDEAGSARLPLPEERWIPCRKVMVVIALREGETTLEEVCRRYSVSAAELGSWVSACERYGVRGLRATRAQIYRDLERAAAGSKDGEGA